MTVSTPLLIGGEERAGGEGTFPVPDPARDGAVVGYAAAASAADAEDAVRAAEQAWPAWAALTAAERAAIALKALDGLDADAGERADILSRENGKVRFEAAIDLQVFAGRFHQAAEFAPELDTPERIAGPPFNTTITKLPAGLVTIIYPFNWPLAILAASLPYALMAGNTVIVKPPNLTNVTLELGGNDPAVILGDADLDQAAFGRLSFATFMTTGQVCMAVKRLYVPRSRYDEVVDGLRATLKPARVGPGLDPDTTMGPLNTARQRDYVAGLCEEARGAGTEVLSFGEYTSGAAGNYLLPALVLDPAPRLKIVTEEQFGPALPVIPYDSEAEAVALANDTWSGLCSSVWSADAEHAMAIAAQLRTGVTFFNNHNATAVDERAPFGGFNASGIGRELGRPGMHEFTETHVMAVPSGG